MADNSSTNSNSWTILAPEVKESGVESMGPLSDGQGAVHAEPAVTQPSALTDISTEQTHPPDPPQVTPLESSEDAADLRSTTEKEDTASSIPAHVENLTSLTPDPGEQGVDDQPLIDTESYSDSYTHISPSPVSASLSGAAEEAEGLLQGEKKGELRKTLREECTLEEKVTEDDGLRRRNVSVLTPLYQRDEDEEEEAEEEQFRHPRREGEGDTGFTLNKCIFGALILLGLGTIFFSGILMDLDDEGDADVKDMKYPDAKKDWVNPSAQGDIPGGVQPPEILDKMAKENQEIAGLQAQLQKQEVELKAAQMQVEEGTKERLRREELEAENQRMRKEMDKLPVLQKDFEQEKEMVKRESERLNKELEALPVMQKELELLRDKVTELTQNTGSEQTVVPSAGQEEVPGTQERKEKKDKKAWDKEKDLRTGNKEWKKEKSIKINEQGGKGKSTKDRKEREKEEDKQGRNKGEGKSRQKEHKREDAQRWKLDGDKKELKEKSGKREWKGDKKWEKEKHGEFVVRKGKEDKEWKQKAGEKEEEWKRDKQASRNYKEWKEKSDKKKDWKERKEWGDEKERGTSGEEKYSEKNQKEKSRKGKKDDHNNDNERKERGEKHRGGKEKNKPKSGQKTEGWKEEKKYKDKNPKKEDKMSRKAKREASHHSYSDGKHSKDHVHVNYWDKQREKIRHFYGSTEECADVTACAHAEGLAPVSQQDFEAFISAYLTKLQGHGDQTSRKEELSKLIGEFFTDGVFVHDQIPFSEFVEDVENILEDMADDDDDDDDDNGADDDDDDDEELENEMNGFAEKAMDNFVLQEKEEKEEKRGGSGKKRMKG